MFKLSLAKIQLAILSLCFLFTIAHAETNKEKILVSTGHWPPFCAEHLKEHGLVSEIVKMIFNEIEQPYKIEFHFWPKAYSKATSGQAMASYPYYYTEEKSEHLLYSDELMLNKELFFFLKDKHPKGIEYNKLTDLKKYKIAGVRGYFYTEEFGNEKLDVTYYSTEKEALKSIHNGESDLIVLSEVGGWMLIEEQYPKQIKNFASIDNPLLIKPLHLVISKNYPKSNSLLAKFNETLNNLKNKGMLDKVVQSHLSKK